MSSFTGEFPWLREAELIICQYPQPTVSDLPARKAFAFPGMTAENCLAFLPLTSSPSIQIDKGHLYKRKKKVNFRGGDRLHVNR